MTRKLVALIPARGGSRSIPLKNIKPFLGRPLIDWTLDAATNSRSVSEVVVATDSDEIARICGNFYERRDPSRYRAQDDPKIKIFRRSPESATDEASTEFVMMEFVKRWGDFDDLIVIQATSPWLKSSDIDKAYMHFQSTGADSLVSVSRQKFFIWRQKDDGTAQPLNYNPQQRRIFY